MEEHNARQATNNNNGHPTDEQDALGYPAASRPRIQMWRSMIRCDRRLMATRTSVNIDFLTLVNVDRFVRLSFFLYKESRTRSLFVAI